MGVGGPRYVSGTKACFEMMGMPMGPPRAPRLPLPEAQRPALREVLRQMGVLAEAEGASGRDAPHPPPYGGPGRGRERRSLSKSS